MLKRILFASCRLWIIYFRPLNLWSGRFSCNILDVLETEHFIGIVATPMKTRMPCKCHWFPSTKMFFCRWSTGFWMVQQFQCQPCCKLADPLGRIHFTTRQQGIEEVHFPGSQRNPHMCFVQLSKKHLPEKQRTNDAGFKNLQDEIQAMLGSSLRAMDVTLHCLKHVWPPLLACWPEKLEHPQRAPSASSRCHTSENHDALATRVKMQTDPASQHAPHTRPTVCDTCLHLSSACKVVGRAEHGTSRLVFHLINTSRDLLVVYVHLNLQPSHVSGVPGASAICNLKSLMDYRWLE